MRLAATLVTTLALVAVGCSQASDEPGTSGSSPRVSTTAGADEGESTPAPSGEPSGLPGIQDVLAAGGDTLDVADADWIQVVGDDAWTAVPGAVVRIDTGGQVTARVPADPGSCLAMDVGYGSLWVGVCDDTLAQELLRIDVATGKLRAAIPLPAGLRFVEEGSVGAGEGLVWVVAMTTTGDKVFVQVDPRTDRVVGRVRAPATATAVRAGLGGVWVTDASDGRLLRLDADTGRVVARIPVGLGARFLDVGEGGVWVQNNTDGTVTHVDPATDEVVATIPVDESIIQGGDLAVGGGSVWARVSSSLVTQIDPATDTVVARYGVPQGSGSVAADDDAVWITAHDVDAVYRIPLR